MGYGWYGCDLGKLIWNLKISCLKTKIIFQTFIFGFKMLIFRGTTWFLYSPLRLGWNINSNRTCRCGETVLENISSKNILSHQKPATNWATKKNKKTLADIRPAIEVKFQRGMFGKAENYCHCLFHRDPYDSLWFAIIHKNWVVFHPLYTLNNQGPFVHCSCAKQRETNGKMVQNWN